MNPTTASHAGKWQITLRAWLWFVVVAFVAYVGLVVAGSGDWALLWIAGFVLVGWPTLAVGTVAAILLTRNGRADPSPSFRRGVSLSLLAWGAAALSLELSASAEYVPAAMLWIAIPTALSVASVLMTRPAGPTA